MTTKDLKALLPIFIKEEYSMKLAGAKAAQDMITISLFLEWVDKHITEHEKD